MVLERKLICFIIPSGQLPQQPGETKVLDFFEAESEGEVKKGLEELFTNGWKIVSHTATPIPETRSLLITMITTREKNEGFFANNPG